MLVCLAMGHKTGTTSPTQDVGTRRPQGPLPPLSLHSAGASPVSSRTEGPPPSPG